VRVTALKRVDLPTFGRPTIPAFSIKSVNLKCERGLAQVGFKGEYMRKGRRGRDEEIRLTSRFKIWSGGNRVALDESVGGTQIRSAWRRRSGRFHLRR
jgi:hypothetical protein